MRLDANTVAGDVLGIYGTVGTQLTTDRAYATFDALYGEAQGAVGDSGGGGAGR